MVPDRDKNQYKNLEYKEKTITLFILQIHLPSLQGNGTMSIIYRMWVELPKTPWLRVSFKKSDTM